MADLKDISVVSPYPIGHISALCFEIRPDDHGYLYISGFTGREITPRELLETDGAADIHLTCNGGILFRGPIKQVAVHRAMDVNRIEITAVTHTASTDKAPHSRSFQDIGMKYGELIEAVLAAYPDSDFLLHADESRVPGAPIVQYRETDWEFLKRVATHFNTLLIPDAVGRGPRVHFGMPDGEEHVLRDVLSSEAGKDIAAFQAAGGDDAGLLESDFLFRIVRARECLSIGDRIKFGNRLFWIMSVVGELAGGEFLFTYRLGQPKSLYRAKRRAETLRGVSLRGRVLSAHNETVRLHLEIDEKQDPETAFPFPFAPVTGNFAYCMPEAGTRVHLYFADGREENARAADCIRGNGDTCAKTAVPDNRYFATAGGKELSVLPGGIGFRDMTESTHGRLSLELDDGYGIRLSSHKTLSLTAGGGIAISTPATVTLSAPSRIVLKEGVRETKSLVTLEDALHTYGRQSIMAGRDRTAYPLFDDEPRAPSRARPQKKEKPGSGFNPFAAALKAIAAVAVVAVVAAVVVAALPLAPLFALPVIASATLFAAAAGKLTYESDQRSGSVRSFREYLTQAFAGWKVGHALTVSLGKSMIENYTGYDFGDDGSLRSDIRKYFGKDLENLSDNDGALAGFNYDAVAGAFYASENPWQRDHGYADIYDALFGYMDMKLDREVIEFTAGGMDYKIEFWKGQYGPSSGGEVGIYWKPHGVETPFRYYESVPGDGEISVQFRLVSKDVPGGVVSTADLAHKGDSDADRTFWPTVFIPGMFNKPEDLSMEVVIVFPEEPKDFGTAFKEQIKDNFKGYPENTYNYDPITNTAVIEWNTATTPPASLLEEGIEEIDRALSRDSAAEVLNEYTAGAARHLSDLGEDLFGGGE